MKTDDPAKVSLLHDLARDQPSAKESPDCKADPGSGGVARLAVVMPEHGDEVFQGLLVAGQHWHNSGSENLVPVPARLGWRVGFVEHV